MLGESSLIYLGVREDKEKPHVGINYSYLQYHRQIMHELLLAFCLL